MLEPRGHPESRHPSPWLWYGGGFVSLGVVFLGLAAQDALHGQIAPATRGLLFEAIGFSIIGVLCLVQAHRSARIGARLTTEGVSAVAVVTTCEPSGFEGLAHRYYKVSYRYQDYLGRSHRGSTLLPDSQVLTYKVNDETEVRYDRERPGRHVWLGLSGAKRDETVVVPAATQASAAWAGAIGPGSTPSIGRLAARSARLRRGVVGSIFSLAVMATAVPQLWRLRSGGWGWWVVVASAAGLGSLSVRRAVAGGREVQAWIQLMRHGAPAPGVVVNIQKVVESYGMPTSLWLFHWIIEYHYEDQRGHSHRGVSGYLSHREASSWKIRDIGQVRFDPDHPEHSVWVGGTARR